MKNSGIEWIGEIPDGWDVVRLKNIAETMKSGGTPNSNNEDFYDIDGTPWVIIADMSNQEYVYDTVKKLSKKGIEDKNLQIFNEGTLLYAMYASVGKVSELKVKATVNQAILAITLDENKVDRMYIKYCLSAIERDIFAESNGNTQFNLNANKVANFCLPHFLRETQQKIAEVLDEKCRKIDKLIENEQKQIEKMKEYKQSVITSAVTKGLDKSAPLKDSGIDWIGEIPAHWDILRGKNVLELLDKPVLSTDEVITCFRDGEVTLRRNRREEGFTFSEKEIGYQGVDIGDLIVHGMDGFAGAIGISDSRGKASPVLIVLNSKQNKHYLMYYLRSMAYRDIFLALSTGIRVRSCDLRWNKLSVLPFLIPDIEEQNEIVSYIDNKLEQIDRLIAIKQEKIEKLQEYKKSLIYEYVTGKKEVV